MSTSQIRIDAHQHFWDPNRYEYPWMTGEALDPIRRPFAPDDLAPELAGQQISGTVLVQTIAHLDETKEFLRLASANESIWGVVGWVDLASGRVNDELDELADSPGGDLLVGIRHQVHDEADPDWLCRADVRRGLQAVQARGLTYDLLVRPRELLAARDTVEALPDLQFVLDHVAKPRIADGHDSLWHERMPALGRYPNLMVKLSGMVTEANWATWSPDDLKPFVDPCLDWFGSSRLMFGSDWPVCLLAATYEEVVDALDITLGGLSGFERTTIFGLNAQLAYRLAAR